VVHPFGVVHDFKRGGVSESSEMSEWARVVAEESEYENGRMTGANSSKRGSFKLCLNLSTAYGATISYPGAFSHSPLEAGHDFDSRSSSRLRQKRAMKTLEPGRLEVIDSVMQVRV
jgi:hypothetical protein